MIKLEFPAHGPRTRQRLTVNEVFDQVRKKWVILTPEEWVRQNLLQYLVVTRNMPLSLISVEKEIRLGDLKKRYDIVIFDRQTRPWMIIECKKMTTALSEDTLQQILRYHMSIPCRHLVITNGRHCFGFTRNESGLVEIHDFPDFDL